MSATNEFITVPSKQLIAFILKKLGQDDWIGNQIFERQVHVFPDYIVHKNGIPIYSIPSVTNSSYRAIAKWLVQLLDPPRKQIRRHFVDDIFHFADTKRNTILSNKIMLSPDVISLFVNRPLWELQFVIRFLLDNNTNVGIPINSLRELLYTQCVHLIEMNYLSTVRWRS